MKITIIGTGYLGLTTAAVLANAGHTVFALELNQDRLNVIKKGKAFFYEEGLDPLIQAGIDKGSLIPTNSYEESIPESEVVFSCVGTPDNPDGSTDLSYIYASASSAAPLLRDEAIFVQKSTVPVGTGRRVQKLLAKSNTKVRYVSNPEFLRESSSVADTLYYDRLIAGGDDDAAVTTVLDIFKNLEKERDSIATVAGIQPLDRDDQYMVVSQESAELIKASANSFLALKISFANSIAQIADKAGADITEVMDAVGADARIGRAFLNAGRGYGGGCFPKDVSGLIHSASEHGVNLSIMSAAQEVNENMPGYIVNKAQEVFGALKGKQVAVLGLAFKAGTSDARKSAGVKLVNILAKSGASVKAYDPKANGEAQAELQRTVTVADSLQTATADAQVIFVATEWPEFIELDWLQQATAAQAIVDCMNQLDKATIQAAGLQYIGVGR